MDMYIDITKEGSKTKEWICMRGTNAVENINLHFNKVGPGFNMSVDTADIIFRDHFGKVCVRHSALMWPSCGPHVAQPSTLQHPLGKRMDL